MVSTLPSSGPEQNPANPYTAPSANTDRAPDPVSEFAARCADFDAKPPPKTVMMPRPMRTMPLIRVISVRCCVSSAPINPSPAPRGASTAVNPA
jgi:hypothetical protein